MKQRVAPCDARKREHDAEEDENAIHGAELSRVR
jgi:hypothetical protein